MLGNQGEKLVKVVDAGSMAASISSDGIDLQGMGKYSFHAVYTGSPNGTLKIQISNDQVSQPSSVINWSDYTGSSTTISAAGDTFYKIERDGERWARLVFTRSSGSGSLNVISNVQD